LMKEQRQGPLLLSTFVSYVFYFSSKVFSPQSPRFCLI
jgi:hypothetical protein